jgi:hypothetical protein
MVQGEPGQNTHTKVTMAVLGVKIDNLTKDVSRIATGQEKLWEAHLKVHNDQEDRLRYVEKLCHDNTSTYEQIVELKTWQEGQKVRTGKLLALQTTISTAIAGALAWLAGKPS